GDPRRRQHVRLLSLRVPAEHDRARRLVVAAEPAARLARGDRSARAPGPRRGATPVSAPSPTTVAGPGRGRAIAKGVLQLLLGVGLFAAILYWVAPPWDEIEDRIDLHLHWLLFSLLGSAFANLVTAARWKLLSEMMGGSRLPYGVYFHYLALTRVLGQVLPTVLVDVIGRSAALRAAGSQSRLGQLIAPVV